jgi:glycerophosphoryl diester phosphodiesterase
MAAVCGGTASRVYRLGLLPAVGGAVDGARLKLPAVICHRGGEASAPENTLAAFAASAAAAAESLAASHTAGHCRPPLQWWVETDVRRTADGELVLLHDARVDRTTSGTGR